MRYSPAKGDSYVQGGIQPGGVRARFSTRRDLATVRSPPRRARSSHVSVAAPRLSFVGPSRIESGRKFVKLRCWSSPSQFLHVLEKRYIRSKRC